MCCVCVCSFKCVFVRVCVSGGGRGCVCMCVSEFVCVCAINRILQMPVSMDLTHNWNSFTEYPQQHHPVTTTPRHTFARTAPKNTNTTAA